MSGLAVGQHLFMRGPNTAFHDVDLWRAKVAGKLDMSSATVAGTLGMDGLEVGQDLFMRGPDTAFQDVDLGGATVGGLLSMIGATVAGTLDMNGVDVGQHLLMRDAKLKHADLSFGHIGHSLESQRRRVQNLDLSATRIEGELAGSRPSWREDAGLILRNTHVGVLHAMTKEACAGPGPACSWTASPMTVWAGSRTPSIRPRMMTVHRLARA